MYWYWLFLGGIWLNYCYKWYYWVGLFVGRILFEKSFVGFGGFDGGMKLYFGRVFSSYKRLFKVLGICKGVNFGCWILLFCN